MNAPHLVARVYSMPLTRPSCPRGPDRFMDRGFPVLTDPEALRAVVSGPLDVTKPTVTFEVIRMPISTGFGDGTDARDIIHDDLSDGPQS
jgi:acetoacetate decarboxylase